ncbi:hypothetical protein JZ751_013471 [Albula glossodonta]|uniref:Uncharacterized protein n=1 Tax=Albula glossodonta TaxID=121402 RepID=A0A8T2N9F6_9TELE|nr:hypothetical protein JZ751_013471 [Albula glossodonta]
MFNQPITSICLDFTVVEKELPHWRARVLLQEGSQLMDCSPVDPVLFSVEGGGSSTVDGLAIVV